jgi:hydrogenase expression/formation protein HypE
MSKFSLAALKRCVFPYVQSENKDVVLGSAFGEDVALTRIGDDLLASHVDPILGAVNDIGWLAVHVACNDIATCGARPRWLQLLVLVPGREDEPLLTQIMKDAAHAAEEIGVAVVGGHTEYSDNLARPLVAVTAFGPLEGRQPVLTRGVKAGDHILVTKGIPLEGTVILAHDFAETAHDLGLTAEDLEEAKDLANLVSVVPEAMILAEIGASAMHDVTDGGLLETLREMAALSELGIQVEYAKIPMPAVARRFAKAFVFDPLRMISSGTLVAAISPEKLAGASEALKKVGIHFEAIGIAFEGQGVHVRRGCETVVHMDVQPEAGELAHMWEVYGRD